jgi:hypothetical protein
LKRSRNGKEVEMKIMNVVRALPVIGLTLCAAMSARAAGPYTLTCDAARSGTVTVTLTGYTVSVTATGESPEGAATGKGIGRRETKFALTVQTGSGKDYETLLSILEDNEELRNCKLIDGQGGTAVTANDNWNQESAKGKNKGKNNPQPSNTGGALEWILTNASVTSVTASGGPNSTGVPATSMQATIEAENFTFTM